MILRPIKTVSSNNEDESLTSQVRRIRRHRGGAGGIRTHDIRRVSRLRVSSRAPEFLHPSILVGLSYCNGFWSPSSFLSRTQAFSMGLARLRPRAVTKALCSAPPKGGCRKFLV